MLKASQLNGWLQFTQIPNPVGAVDITIEGANIQTLSDNWFVARYRYVDPPMDSGPDLLDGASFRFSLSLWGAWSGHPCLI